jgi:uncharacterized delta-60 repeat protein
MLKYNPSLISAGKPMRRLIIFALAAFALAFGASAQAVFGDKDCSFGNAGVHAVSGAYGAMMSAAAEADGNIVVRMGFISTGSNIYRIGADGTTSIQVGSVGNVNIYEAGTVVQADGRIVVSTGCGLSDCAGNVYSGGTPPGIARFLPTGGLDSTFGTGGYARLNGLTNAYSRPLLQPDGRIVVSSTFNGSPALVRFNADGSLDATFGSGGVAQGGSVLALQSIALQSDGLILAGGGSTLTRYSPNGQLDASFGSGGTAQLGQFSRALFIGLQPGGKILVVGTDPSISRLRIARYDSTGALDMTAANGVGYRDVTFGSAGVFTQYSPYYPLAMMADGRPVIVGTPSSGPAGAMIRYTVDLADDAEVALDFPPSAAFVLPTGRTIVGRQNGSNQVRRFLGDADSATCIATSTTMSSSPNPSNYGQSVTLAATVTPASAPPAQGSVQFRQGTTNLGSPVPLNNGIATHQTSSLAEGTNTLTAVFSGAGLFLNSTSPPTAHTVSPRPASTTTLSSSPNPSSCGQPVTLTGTVAPASGSGTPTGTVQFNLSPFSSATVTMSNGVATYVQPSFSSGTHSLTAVYSGDANFGPSTSTAVSHVVPTCITVNDPLAQSGSAPTQIPFTVSLTASSSSTVQVSYATADRSAIAGTDYTATSGTLTFDPGETTKVVNVPILAQPAPHPNKDFFLVLSNPVNASLPKGAGIGTIRYASSDELSIYADDAIVVEGHTGITLLGFTLSLNRFNNSPVTVNYATADGTAFAGSDYTAQSGSITFARGVMQRWVVVPIAANVTVQPNRSFFLNLSNPSGAVLSRAQGSGTILDDDPAAPASTVPMYRLYSDVTKEHLYTTDANEYAVLGTSGWVQEGTAWTMFGNGTHAGQFTIPLYRMYHPGIRQHHWTTDANEIMVLASQGAWQYERISGYLLPSTAAGSTPLYRLMYHTPPLHLWTTDENEKNVLSSQYGWVYEGVVGEVMP